MKLRKRNNKTGAVPVQGSPVSLFISDGYSEDTLYGSIFYLISS